MPPRRKGPSRPKRPRRPRSRKPSAANKLVRGIDKSLRKGVRFAIWGR